MASVSEYYEILGIGHSASATEIKQAYLKRAKELHPDKNKSPDAHEQFILLNEAYRYLIAFKQGNLQGAHTTNEYKQNWEDYRKEETRQRARRFAQMKYREFVNSDEYRMVFSLDVIANHFMVAFLWLVVVIAPVLATIYYGVEGLVGAAIPMGVLVHFLVFKLKEKATIDFELFKQAVRFVIHTAGFYILIYSVFNMFLVLKIGLQTLVPLYVFPLVLLLPGIALQAYYAYNKPAKNVKNIFYAFCLWPLVVNIFFLVNFIFSSNPTVEKYFYHCATQSTRRGGVQKTSYIYLAGDKYDEYPGIRYFIDFDQLKGNDKIKYTFADGLFGLRIMKDYEFIFEPPEE